MAGQQGWGCAATEGSSGSGPQARSRRHQPHTRGERMHAGNLANRLHETSCAQKQQPPMRVCYLVGAVCRALAPVTAAGTAVLLKQFSMK